MSTPNHPNLPQDPNQAYRPGQPGRGAPHQPDQHPGRPVPVHPSAGPTAPGPRAEQFAGPVPPPVPTPPAPSARRNTLALVALALAVLGSVFALIHGAMIIGWILLPVAFILSIVALVQRDRPKGVAIAALVVSVVGTIVGIIAFIGAVGDAVGDAFDDAVGQSSTPAPQTSSSSAGAQSGTQEGAQPGSDSQAVAPQPFNASGLLGGNAAPDYPEGEPGKVSVVKIGSMLKDQGVLLFAFRNNTEAAISHVDWSATARSAGSIVGSGSSQGSTPSQIQPGEVGLSYIYFDNAESIPEDVEYEFQVTTTPADTSFFNTAPLKVTEAAPNGESIVGGATNGTGAAATGPFMATVYCFEGDDLVDMITGSSDQDTAAPGADVSFSVPLYSSECSTFALGVSGYFD